MTSRHYCITVWDVTKDLISMCNDKVRYLVYQKERCPTTGKLHFQGYIEMKSPVRGTTIQKLFGCKAEKDVPSQLRFFLRNGTREQARDYCMKEDTRVEGNSGPWEFGNFDDGGQGTRNDIAGLYQMVKDEKKNIEIMEANPELYMRTYRALDRVRAEIIKKKSESKFRNVDVKIIWGAPGTGKTRQVYDQHGYEKQELFRIHVDEGQPIWWDGYQGEKVLLIDEFYGQISYSKMLEILDGYSVRLPIKGGFTYSLWETVYITSNSAPESWYSQGLTDALKRRISSIVHLENKVQDVVTENVSDTEKLDVSVTTVEGSDETSIVNNVSEQVCHELAGVIEDPASFSGNEIYVGIYNIPEFKSFFDNIDSDYYQEKIKEIKNKNEIIYCGCGEPMSNHICFDEYA
jgi:hypothetical protein